MMMMDTNSTVEKVGKKRSMIETDAIENHALTKQNGVSSPKKIKADYKEVTGQLVHKTRLSINNEFFYTFGILSDNKVKDYYGSAKIFSKIEEGKCYRISLNYVKTKNSEWIEINKCEECEINNEVLVPTDYYLTNSHFEKEEQVNTLAKFKCMFKKLNAYSYKLVFEINYKNLDDEITVVQVECSATVKNLLNIFKVNGDIGTLIALMKTNENKIYNVYNVKCQTITQGQNVFFNWNITSSTRFELCDNLQNEMCESLIQQDSKINISRCNKYISDCNATQIKFDLDENDNGSSKFLIQFKSDDPLFHQHNNASTSSDWIKSVFYVNTNKNTETDNLPKLTADLNQIAELLDDGLIKLNIYFTVDDCKNVNVLSFLKSNEDDNEYLFL
jgi:Nucleopolyhedrovirus late expression factor 3 (LEF-3)